RRTSLNLLRGLYFLSLPAKSGRAFVSSSFGRKVRILHDGAQRQSPLLIISVMRRWAQPGVDVEWRKQEPTSCIWVRNGRINFVKNAFLSSEFVVFRSCGEEILGAT
ncbi:hypothetical protein PV325_010355, partial [Microctonus aethiopoides]